MNDTLASVGAYDAKTRLSESLDRVEKGELIVISRHVKPVARLVPEGGDDRAHAGGSRLSVCPRGATGQAGRQSD
jgi:prevent-host-death family protein